MVTFLTSDPRAPRLPIRVNLTVLGALDVAPERLVLQPGQATNAQHVKIRKLQGAGLAIVGVESSNPDFTATTTAVSDGREYDVAVQYTGKRAHGSVSARITVRTNEPAQSAIVIPVMGRL
jgi:hypothetical protein